MGLSIGEVVAIFDANIKGFDAGIKKAESQMSGFQKSVDKAGKRIGKSFEFIGGAVIGASKAAGLAGAAFATFGIKAAADLQMLSTSFETLTGSAEKGQKLFQDLVEMDKYTPFELGDLAKATQTMLGYGISVEQTQKSLNMLGDISLGDRNKLQSLSLAFAQVQGNGRLMGQELLQMVNAGFNPLQIISEKTGKSMSVLRDEMADGKISFEMVADAMKTATSEGGLFYKGMERGSQTLSGKFSTLVGNIKLMASGIVGLDREGKIVEGSFASIVDNGLTRLNTALGSIDWNKVSADIGHFLRTTKAGIEGLKALIFEGDFQGSNNLFGMGEDSPFVSFVLDARKAVISFWDSLQPVIASVKEFFVRYIQAYIPTLQIFVGILLMLATQVLAALKYAWEQLKPAVEELIAAFSDFWEQIQPILQGVAIIITAILIPVFQYLLAFVVQVFKGLIQTITGALNFISGVIKVVFGAVVGVITGDFSLLGQGIKQVFDGIVRAAEGIRTMLFAPFRAIVDSIQNIFTGIDFFKIAVNWIGELIRGIQSKIGGAGNAIKEGIGRLVPEGVRKLIPGLANGVRNFAGGLAVVGERGPELVNLPQGADVFSNQESKGMMGGAGITIENMNIKSNVDWQLGTQYMAQKLRLS